MKYIKFLYIALSHFYIQLGVTSILYTYIFMFYSVSTEIPFTSKERTLASAMDYYEITLWVTIEQEAAIVELFKHKQWTYTRSGM